MSGTYRPSAGQIALVEFAVRTGSDPLRPESLTGLVVADSEEEWSIDLDGWANDLDEGALVTVSVFAQDALYRMRGTAHYRWASHLALQPVYEVERIQRRSWPRLAMRVNVTLAAVEGAGADFTGVTGRTIDISVGGLQVETVRQLPFGADPTVVLTLPDGGTLVARTRIVHADADADGFRYRLAFNQIEDSDTTRLMTLAGTSR